MRYPLKLRPSLTTNSWRHRYGFAPRALPSGRLKHGFFQNLDGRRAKAHRGSNVITSVLTIGFVTWLLYPSEEFAQLSTSNHRESPEHERKPETNEIFQVDRLVTEEPVAEETAWTYFSRQFEFLSVMADLEWVAFSDKIVDAILPEWSKLVPGYIKKLQSELSASPGSLADEIWQEAHDPLINPEIDYSASVRVSPELCPEEKDFLSKRKASTRAALAKYLGINEKDIHPDDVPTIAMCGSGGGLRALIAGTGSLLATEEDGLFDCVTYTAGVSGSCWLQMLYLSSFSKGSVSALLNHLKARAGIHIAYPPVAFSALNSLPTSKYLLSGLVEKLKGDEKAEFGLVDIYGLLLGARYLIPKGELGVNASDFKLSNQRELIKSGQYPLPIYTAVRHEIPAMESEDGRQATSSIVRTEEEVKAVPYFQWYEITPYEFFCEEFGAGIPTWALGRKFERGRDVPPESGFHLPELRAPLLMGIFGSAFCATLSHYYREIRPLMRTMSGFGTVDEMISGRDDDLSKVHPIDPATIPNFAYRMHDMLPRTTPKSVLEQEYIQLMDAGMSNNLPIYPLLRPGREVDVLISFDASADIKTDNWLSVADGYARQRGIKGWPLGVGWPKEDKSAEQAREELSDAQADTPQEADRKVKQAQEAQKAKQASISKEGEKSTDDEVSKFEPGNQDDGDLGYCTVWVGTTEERSTSSPPISKPIDDSSSWQLMEPNAGLAVVYLPLLANDKVPGISPGTSEYLSTWNFVYTPEQIDSVVKLARTNYDEGKEQIRATVRAVYERKKQLREEAARKRRMDAFSNFAQRGEKALLGEGDQFS